MTSRPSWPFLHRWDPSRYPNSYGALPITEADVVKVVVGALVVSRVLPFVIDAGSRALRGRAYGKLKGLGIDLGVLAGKTGAAAKGFPDIVGIQIGTGRFVAIEVKKPGANPRAEQVEWLARAWQAGALVGVAWAAKDVETILKGEIDE